MSLLHFEIATPERVVLKEAAQQVTIPTREGDITVLPKHMPLVSILKPGVLEIKNADGQLETMAVSGGFVEVLPTKVVVLADTAERAAEIDEARAEEARKRAEALMSEQAEAHDVANVEALLAKELARLAAVRRYKTLRSRS